MIYKEVRKIIKICRSKVESVSGTAEEKKKTNKAMNIFKTAFNKVLVQVTSNKMAQKNDKYYHKRWQS